MALALSACCLLFLEAAATIDLVYTIRPSFLLLSLALALGAPTVLRGWLALPPLVRWAAAALLLIHLSSAVLGDHATLPGNGRAGPYRDMLYTSYLVMGVGVVALLLGLLGSRPGARPRQCVIALSAGAVLAAAYGLYQWLAQRYGLPLTDLNNTRDSNGVTSGGLQGNGLFGWERIRGTFLEPHFLGAYLAGLTPLVALLAWTELGWRRRAFMVGVVVVLAALVLTASAPAFASLGVGAVIALAVAAVARGHVRVAALAGAMLAAVIISLPVVFTAPHVLASATGRSGQELELTTRFRETAWTASIDIWSRRPAFGYGPGQSSVRLARELDGPRARLPLSAQGLWAAALIDTGAIGLACWVALLGGLIVTAGGRVVRDPSALRVCAFFAATAALLSSLAAGDRLGLSAWVLLGLLAALSTFDVPRVSDGASDARPMLTQGRDQAS